MLATVNIISAGDTGLVPQRSKFKITANPSDTTQTIKTAVVIHSIF